jgi:hypothetical protein
VKGLLCDVYSKSASSTDLAMDHYESICGENISSAHCVVTGTISFRIKVDNILPCKDTCIKLLTMTQ